MAILRDCVANTRYTTPLGSDKDVLTAFFMYVADSEWYIATIQLEDIGQPLGS